jgi:YidC/Oxa1 family membrane protein insertase
MFQAIIHGMGRLLAYFYEVIPNYGVAIILLTVAVRLAMIPLAVKQARVMEANRGNQEKIRKLAPEIKKLKEKYRDDRARLYEEQKKLYDLHGINMLGSLSGCLPMLLQMPIFMAMYQVLSGCNKLFGGGRVCRPQYFIPGSSDLHTAIAEGQARFLSMNLNLRPSQVYATAGLPEALPYYLLIVLMGVTMWYQTKMMTKAQPAPDPQLAQTQKIMQIMPLMFVVFSVNFPVGLTVYWTASNVWTIGQQYVLLKRIGIPSTAEGARPTPSAAPGFLGRLLSQNAGSTRPEAKKPGRPASKPSARRERPSPKSRAKPGGATNAKASDRTSRSREARSGGARHRSAGARVGRSPNGAPPEPAPGGPQPAPDGSKGVIGEKAVGGIEEDGAGAKGRVRNESSQPAKAPRQSSGKGASAKRGGGTGGTGRAQGKGRPRGGGSKSKTSSHRKNRGGRR